MTHCTGCGRPAADCAGGCTSDLDPPRFCPRCGRRLAVQVFPGHVVVRCPAGADHMSPA
ncbi:MAG: hypothetical protein Q8K72_12200 [Acidimicrobiales bacterium]|nr:hypothetical protein [Acidimicrobiales bacterium]